MTQWLKVTSDGSMQVVNDAQKRVGQHLGGEITFVGALPSLNAFLLARVTSEDPARHAWSSLGVFLQDTDVRGDVAVICSGEDGREEDLDVHGVRRLISELRNR